MNRDDAVKALDAALTKMQKGGRYTPEDVDDLERCARDVLDLLKAQEPVEPTLDIRHGKSMWRCGSCATALQPNHIHTKFCFNCGKAVKWK